MQTIAALLVKRRIADWDEGDAQRGLRMPLGLVLLSRGWITRDELHASLEAQRRHGQGMVGEWLRRLSGISAAAIAKGLAAQWNCTALLEAGSTLQPVVDLVPPTLLRRYGLVLIRHAPSGRLYLAGRSKAEVAAAQAVQHVLQVPVEAAFLEDDHWLRRWDALAAVDERAAEPAPHLEGPAVQIAEVVERRVPAHASMVRVHDHLWVRMRGCRGKRSAGSSAEDVLIPLRAQAGRLRVS